MSDTRFEVYVTTFCPYCVRAKSLLKKKGLAYSEIDVTGDEEKRAWLVKASGGRRTVPHPSKKRSTSPTAVRMISGRRS